MDEPIKSPESQAEEKVPETPVSVAETTKAELNNTDDGEHSQDIANDTANVNDAIDGGSVDDGETDNNESKPIEKNDSPMEVDDTPTADADSQDVEMNDTDKPEDIDKVDENDEDVAKSDVEKELAELDDEEAGKFNETDKLDDVEAVKFNETDKLDDEEAGKFNETDKLDDEEAGKPNESAEVDDQEAGKLTETTELDDEEAEKLNETTVLDVDEAEKLNDTVDLDEDESGKLTEAVEKSDKSAESKDEDQEDKTDDNEKISSKNADESMDQDELDRPEQVDMENINETVGEKDKSFAEDPFDVLRNSTSVADDSHQPDENDTTAPAIDNDDGQDDDDDDSVHQDDGDKLDDDESVHQDDADKTAGENQEDAAGTTDDATDDIEQGKGIDEELSLLPDAEREITDADKERAILAEDSADKETVTIDDDDDVEEHPSVEDTTNKDTNETANDENIASANDDTGAGSEQDSEMLASAPKEGQIKELQDDLPESKCTSCETTRLCKFTLLQSGVIEYLCEIDCVNTFRKNHPEENFTLTMKKVSITQIADTSQSCFVCGECTICKFRVPNASSDYDYLCNDGCVSNFIGSNVEKYTIKKKRYTIEEISETTDKFRCIQCFDSAACRFTFKQDEDELYICQENCLNLLMKEQPDRFRIKRRSVRVRDLPKRAGLGSATITSREPATPEPATKMLARTETEAEAARRDREASFVRRCAQCFSVVFQNDRSLLWETLDFCNETCLGQYQNVIGAACTTCQNEVTLTSLGKYCVRFGYEIRQFCRAACLDEFKKGLKVCSYCQKDISKESDGFLASIANQFKDFCSQQCLRKYDVMLNPKKIAPGICAVCNNVDQVRVEILVDQRDHGFCSNPCFSAFKFVNNIVSDNCAMCSKYFERKSDDAYTIYQDKTTLMYCSKVCMNIYIITNRKIVPCQWCKVKKYNFDMIQKYSGKSQIMLCSLNCLTLCEVSMNAISMKKQSCNHCNTMTTPQYHLTMSDASIRNFCTYQCVMSFQSQFSRAPLTLDGEASTANSPVPTGLPKRIKTTTTVTNAALLKSNAVAAKQSKQTPKQLKTLPKTTKVNKNAQITLPAPGKSFVISNVQSLAAAGINTRTRMQPVVELEPLPPTLLKKSVSTYAPKKRITYSATAPSPPPREATPPPPPPPRVEVKTQIVTLPPMPKRVSNMMIMCKPAMESKEVMCKPTSVSIGCQTDSSLEKRHIIPIPVPIYIPQPMHMYSLPMPIPVPIPMPIPVPIFIPTTRNSANGIMKEIKKIQDKMPTDPFEAELLMMAEMVAGDKKKSDSDSGSDDEPEEDYATETITESNALGEDMLQMALKMAQEYDEPAVDLESAMTANTITPSSHPHLQYEGEVDDHNAIQHHHMLLMEQQRQAQMQQSQRGGRKRGQPAQARNNRTAGTPPGKRARRQDMIIMSPPQPEPPREPVEKADANMCLKFTFGVNAWKQWVMTKNADLEKSSIRRKPFKSELLQLTADELNYSLCLFVKEVRKPNGSEYAPDTIYYLVLGIQQYLYENGRIDNIFTDPYYEKFTDCLDDVAKKFSVLYNDSQYIVTRVEEEHLWECKQLGAHSPHVLLSTLMFFNTKHFNLTTVEEHMQLSFSHIMKHWKRNPNQVGAPKLPGSRNVLLRFYPPQSALENNSRKKKVYEQQENEENPLRCPVKLYEFYLSKCPESVKTRNDVFYLQPERSCVPDSPVWYSTQALGKDSLCKMLHRVKMVKEINIALLTS